MLTIGIIKVFYKDPSIPVPVWLNYITMKILRPFALFVKINKDEQDGSVNKVDIFHNNSRESLEEEPKSARNYQMIDWKTAARIIDGFLLSFNICSIFVAALSLFLYYYFA